MAIHKSDRSGPLTVRECADYMGVSTEWVRQAITCGRVVRGAIVYLEAWRPDDAERSTHYRIHEHKFLTFLRAIDWKHLPRAGVGSIGLNGRQPLAPR